VSRWLPGSIALLLLLRACCHRVSERIFDAMHLSAYDGTVLDLSGLASDKASVQRVRQREWALFNASRACPDCLAESGGIWKLWWRLAGAAVCPAHRRVLMKRRFEVGEGVRKSWSSRWRETARGTHRPRIGRAC
jgi:hypothetical protein